MSLLAGKSGDCQPVLQRDGLGGYASAKPRPCFVAQQDVTGATRHANAREMSSRRERPHVVHEH